MSDQTVFNRVYIRYRDDLSDWGLHIIMLCL